MRKGGRKDGRKEWAVVAQRKQGPNLKGVGKKQVPKSQNRLPENGIYPVGLPSAGATSLLDWPPPSAGYSIGYSIGYSTGYTLGYTLGNTLA